MAELADALGIKSLVTGSNPVLTTNNNTMGNQIKQIIENFSKNEDEKIKIRSEKKSKTKRKIKQISDKSKQSGSLMVKR